MDVYREQHWGRLRQLPYEFVSDCDLHDESSLQNACGKRANNQTVSSPTSGQSGATRTWLSFDQAATWASALLDRWYRDVNLHGGQARTAPRKWLKARQQLAYVVAGGKLCATDSREGCGPDRGGREQAGNADGHVEREQVGCPRLACDGDIDLVALNVERSTPGDGAIRAADAQR